MLLQIRVSAFDFFCNHHKAAVGHMVAAGGECQKMISELGRDTCVIKGHGLDILIKIFEFFRCIRLKKHVKFECLIALSEYLRAEHGNYLIIPLELSGIQGDESVFITKFRILVVGELSEHQTARHVVPVDDEVGCQRVKAGVGVEDQTAVVVAAAATTQRTARQANKTDIVFRTLKIL